MNDRQRIVIFDGYCNFCSKSVLFIIKRDRHARFVFAASQSYKGQRILKELGLMDLAAHSIVLIDRGRIYERSGAALLIARGLRGGWPLFYGFMIFPRGLRDFFYDHIARNRYRLFGTREHCFVPADEIKNRFIGFPPVP